MTLRFHSLILATSVAATLAVGIASAAIVAEQRGAPAAKADRLPVVVAEGDFVTVETRQDGVSILQRIPVNPD